MKRKRRRKLKYKRILLLIPVLIIIIGGIIFLVSYLTKDKKPTTIPNNNTITEVSDNNNEDNEQIYKTSMVMVGDNIIHESVYVDAKNNANGTGYDFKPMYELVKPIISKYDIAYVNQETVIGGSELGVSGYPSFNSPYEVADALIDTGFNLVSLATNHILDSGIQAIKNSREYWSKQENVLAVGSYLSTEERNTIQIKEANNITYTMLNYTYGTNGYSVSENYLVNVWPTSNNNANVSKNTVANDTKYQAYKNQVKEDIERVRNKVDVLIVAMHWGVEYTKTPTAYQKDAAQFLADLGVDIIIGTHPHVIEPVEWIDNTIVFYSLGNFLSSQYQTDYYNKVVGLMGSLEITKTVEAGESTITINNVCTELLYTYYENQANDLRGNIKIIPFSNMNSIYLKDYEKVYENYKKVVQMYDNNICVRELS